MALAPISGGSYFIATDLRPVSDAKDCVPPVATHERCADSIYRVLTRKHANIHGIAHANTRKHANTRRGEDVMSGEGFRSVGGSETLRWGRSNPPLGETPTPVGASRHPRAEESRPPSGGPRPVAAASQHSRPKWFCASRVVEHRPSLITIQLSKIDHPEGFGTGRQLGSPKRWRPHVPSCLMGGFCFAFFGRNGLAAHADNEQNPVFIGQSRISHIFSM